MSAPTTPLALYRAILRAAGRMPTKNRRHYIWKKARSEFDAAKREADPARIQFLMDYGLISLENINAQANHLRADALFAPSPR
jgi:hypothetical protein